MKKKFISIIFKIIRPYLKLKLFSFKKSLKIVSIEQEKVFKKILAQYEGTQFGHDFKILKNWNYNDFVRNIPVQSYESLHSYIEKERLGENNSILRDPVQVWEKTSGSSGTSKNIPYTKSLLQTIHRAIIIWLADILSLKLNFQTGKVFFSLSPVVIKDAKHTSSFEDDSEYLPPLLNSLFSEFFVIPKEIKKIKEPHQFKLLLSQALLKEKDLETLFIWSPSYFLSLIDFMNENKQEVLEGLQRERRDEVRFLWGSWDKVWTKMKFISCWADGSAKFFIPRLQSMFPQSFIQGKGLISTESPLTIPFSFAKAPIPLIKDIFFEFENSKGNIFRLHELQLHEEYEIIISNFSGLIRYRMGDLVRVEDFYEKTPCLSFQGRRGNLSDLTGEKLGEVAVQKILFNLLDKDENAFLAPKIDEPSYYICFYDGENESFSDLLEEALCEIFHYRQSRELGQLSSIRVIKVNSTINFYNDFYIKRGMMWGDIKYTSLIKSPEITSELLKMI